MTLARAAEAKAQAAARLAQPIDQVATDIYEGPALMARYRGETRDGVHEGFGVLTLPDSGIEQAGEFHNGLPNGWGVERDPQGRVLYEGRFVDGVRAEPGRAYAPVG